MAIFEDYSMANNGDQRPEAVNAKVEQPGESEHRSVVEQVADACREVFYGARAIASGTDSPLASDAQFSLRACAAGSEPPPGSAYFSGVMDHLSRMASASGTTKELAQIPLSSRFSTAEAPSSYSAAIRFDTKANPRQELNRLQAMFNSAHIG